MSYKTEEILENIAVIAFGSAIGGFILFVLYIFILFPLFHDCGRWICSHNPDVSWSSYFICFCICAAFLTICFLCAESEKGSTRPTKRFQNRRTTHYSSGRETDYYDSDMEGAPGYYGFD